MSSEEIYWYNSREQIISFANILAASGVLLSADDAIEYFVEPWNRTSEFDIWDRAGRPRPPSPDDLAEARMCGPGPRADELNQAYSDDSQKWDAFVAVLEAYEHGEAPLAALPTPEAPELDAEYAAAVADNPFYPYESEEERRAARSRRTARVRGAE